MLMNTILDKSIYFSFDLSGYHRHEKNFSPINYSCFEDKEILVTGGTSGIGESIYETLIKSGAKTLFSGRKLKNEKNRDDFVSLDLNNHIKVIEFANHIDSLDGVVLNAGGMPENYEESHGYESQFASQVLGHFILVRKLIDLGKIKKNAHVIWMSSGGMYFSKFDDKLIKNSKEKYDKVGFYANAKRAQVILNDYLHHKYTQNEIQFSVMHPGWVNTSGVRDAIPGFFNFTKNRLRNPTQGADTAIWLLSKKNIESGEFWFDRKVQKKIIFPWTKNNLDQKQRLIKICEDYYQSICQS